MIKIELKQLLDAAERLANEPSTEGAAYSPFILGCGTRASADPEGFSLLYRENELLRTVFQRAMSVGSENHTQIMKKVLQLKRISLV